MVGVGEVASGEGHGDGDVSLLAGFDDGGVSFYDADGGHFQVGEGIFGHGVAAGEVEGYVGGEAVEEIGEGLVEDVEVCLVVGFWFEFDVEVGSWFGEGVDVVLVHGEGEDVGVEGEDEGGAIAVVDVEVDDHGGGDGFFLDEGADGDGYVVVDAEAFAGVGEGMVETSAEVDGDAGLEGAASGEEGAAGDGAEGLEEAGFDEVGIQVGEHGDFEPGGDIGGIFEVLVEQRGVDPGDLVVGDGIGGEGVVWADHFIIYEFLVDFSVFVEVEGMEIFDAAEVDLIFVGVNDVEVHGENAKF